MLPALAVAAKVEALPENPEFGAQVKLKCRFSRKNGGDGTRVRRHYTLNSALASSSIGREELRCSSSPALSSLPYVLRDEKMSPASSASAFFFQLFTWSGWDVLDVVHAVVMWSPSRQRSLQENVWLGQQELQFCSRKWELQLFSNSNWNKKVFNIEKTPDFDTRPSKWRLFSFDLKHDCVWRSWDSWR